MKRYMVEMCENGQAYETESVDAETQEAAEEQAAELTEDWIGEGDYGPEGCIVQGSYRVYPEGEDPDDYESVGVEVLFAPDDDALIESVAPECVYCDHVWTAEGEGGCRENPGVWSLGGTTILITDHCQRCGLQRRRKLRGSQRNPGEMDTVEYLSPMDEEVQG